MKLTLAICDDDRSAVEQLEASVRKYYKLKNTTCPEICTFFSANDMLQGNTDYDIVFLDIELSGKKNGIRLGGELKKRNPNIIIFFITSYERYLDDAMDYSAFRFLTKPLEQARLFRSIDKAMEKFRQFTHTIPVKTPDDTQIVYTRDIIMVEVVLRKVYLYTPTGIIRSTTNFKTWIKDLCDLNEFFQPHRCYIVGLKHVTSYDHREIKLFNSTYTVPISRDLYSDFNRTITLYYADVSKDKK